MKRTHKNPPKIITFCLFSRLIEHTVRMENATVTGQCSLLIIHCTKKQFKPAPPCGRASVKCPGALVQITSRFISLSYIQHVHTDLLLSAQSWSKAFQSNPALTPLFHTQSHISYHIHWQFCQPDHVHLHMSRYNLTG